MNTLSTHVLDATAGAPAVGLHVTLTDTHGTSLGAGVTDDGRLIGFTDALPEGTYHLTFATGDWFSRRGVGVGEAVDPPQRQVGELAGRPAHRGLLRRHLRRTRADGREVDERDPVQPGRPGPWRTPCATPSGCGRTSCLCPATTSGASCSETDPSRPMLCVKSGRISHTTSVSFR